MLARDRRVDGAFGSAISKSVSSAYGTGVHSYLFDSIFKSGGRLPYTAASLMVAAWDRPYSREISAFPLATLKQMKFWPPVDRVANVYGERNLFSPSRQQNSEPGSTLSPIILISN